MRSRNSTTELWPVIYELFGARKQGDRISLIHSFLIHVRSLKEDKVGHSTKNNNFQPFSTQKSLKVTKKLLYAEKLLKLSRYTINFLVTGKVHHTLVGGSHLPMILTLKKTKKLTQIPASHLQTIHVIPVCHGTLIENHWQRRLRTARLDH